jgi:molecular chaperone GrpE
MEEENKDTIYEEEDGAGDISLKIKKLKEKLEVCQKEKQEYLSGWQRAQADFVNYKRRQEEQMAEWSKMLGEGLIRDILPVLDSLEKAEDEGAVLIKKQLLKILEKHGLERMASEGNFDPNLHEAVEFENSEGEEGKILKTIQPGYLLNGKVIRPAKIKINKQK